MPRPHREGILKASPDTEIKLGQTWENRWTHVQQVVTGGPDEQGVVVIRGQRLGYIRADVLRRDYVLLDA